MMTVKEILNVITTLPAEEAAAEIKKMAEEDSEWIINSVTLHIQENYYPGDTRRAIRDYYNTVKEIERVIQVIDKWKSA